MFDWQQTVDWGFHRAIARVTVRAQEPGDQRRWVKAWYCLTAARKAVV